MSHPPLIIGQEDNSQCILSKNKVQRGKDKAQATDTNRGSVNQKESVNIFRNGI